MSPPASEPVDILRLRALVAPTQQDHNLCSAMHIVDSVTRPIVDAHFEDAVTDASGVAGISHLHAANAAGNARDCIGIPETVQPARKLLRLTHVHHERHM